jgi:peptide/nickel transport system permease protein
VSASFACVPRPFRHRPLAGLARAASGFVRAQPLGAGALAVILLLAFAAMFAGHLAPYDPVEIDFEAMLAPPSAAHPFGTDAFGRDILTRIVFGARTALSIGLLSSALGCSAGAVLGLLSAYWGGWADLLIQRVVDILLSFPIIVLAMVVVAVMGQHAVGGIDLNLIAAIAIPIVPHAERVIRAATLGLRGMAYVDAARVAGFSATRIVFRHMAPNVTAPFIVMATAYMGQAILLEASLSFLGLGITDPTPAWGLMLAGDSATFYQEAPWMILAPGAAISLTVFAFNLFGDALRDWLDPRLRL